jgi:hypothetical protein
MSLTHVGIVIDRREAASIFASRDPEIWARLTRDEQRRPSFGADPGRTRDLFESALHEILIGAACETHEAHHYAYVLEAFCLAYGQPAGEASGAIDRVMASPIPFRNEWFVPIPDTPEWPAVALLSPSECAVLAARSAESGRESDAGGDSGFRADSLAMLDRAIEARTDLIIFMY